jgi:competence protein ComEA
MRKEGIENERVMRYFAVFAPALILALTACTTQQRSPDEIRRETATATSAAARDAKAVAQGVADGLKHGSAVNINKASQKDLETLPGIDEAAANRIVDNRPYDNSGDLVKKRVISKPQYDHIADKVTTH